MKQIGKNVILQQIAESKFPCWNLYDVSNYKKILLRSYNCEDIQEDADIEKKVAKSLRNLENVLAAFPDDARFAIEIKASKNANGSSFYGPIEFINSENISEGNSLNGMPTMPNIGELQKYGLCTSGEMNAKLEAIEQKHAQQLAQMQLDLRRQMLEQEYKQKMAALNAEKSQMEKRLRDSSNSINKVCDIINRCAPYVLGQVLKIPIAQPLQGTPEPTAPPDARRDAIESLATNLFESSLTEDEIQQIKLSVNDLIRKNNASVYQNQTADAATVTD